MRQSLPTAALQDMKMLGSGFKIARIRRRISVRSMAERMDVSPDTVVRLERGDPGIAIGVISKATAVLGLGSRLGVLVEPTRDTVGQALELSRLPKAVRSSTDRDLDF